MRLNHINLSVSDVGAAKSFLERYFAMKDIGGGNRNRAFLMDDGGLVLSMFKGKDVKYPGTFHIGFGQPDEAAVNAIYERMKADGITADAPQRSHGWTFYVNAPGGFVVEVLAP
jgi:catechol 2,3-dioxygenase-like lactoylglutathione lyase family enzyme